MTHIDKMIVAEGGISSSRDELNMLISARSMRQLGKAIIDLMYNNHNALFNSLINRSPHAGEYDFGIVRRAFAEYSVASTRIRRGRPIYFMNQRYSFGPIDLYLSGEWYAIYHAQPAVNPNWLSFNDLVRVLNACFNANFVYIVSDSKVSDSKHQLWGPSETL